jgi:hypothetical protein
MRRLISLFFVVILVWNCRGSVIIHDEELAAKQAAGFAYTTFVKQDAKGGYSLLADSTKQQLSFDQFSATNAKLHPSTFPTRVTATEFEPIPGQKAMNIFLVGENGNEKFYYRLPVEGTMKEGYKVSGMYRGNGPYPASKLRQKLKADVSAG